MAFSFTGFDGISRNLPDFPSSVFEYDYYLLLSIGKAFTIVCFNSEITVESSESSIVFSTSDSNYIRRFHKSPNNGFWSDSGELNSLSLSSLSEFIYSSENLLKHKDLIVSKNFAVPVSETTLSFCTLSPVIENIYNEHNIVKSTFFEIFSILTILIVFLVSFIGIKKCILYLHNFLKSS